MKTSERVINALQRVKELLFLVSDWLKKPKEEDALNKEFKVAKQKLIDALQGQYDTRSKYASPNATGIQGLIAEPIVNQPQTGYNNINEIMRRYIG